MAASFASREELAKLKREELARLAAGLNVAFTSKTTKEQLIDRVWEARATASKRPARAAARPAATDTEKKKTATPATTPAATREPKGVMEETDRAVERVAAQTEEPIGAGVGVGEMLKKAVGASKDAARTLASELKKDLGDRPADRKPVRGAPKRAATAAVEPPSAPVGVTEAPTAPASNGVHDPQQNMQASRYHASSGGTSVHNPMIDDLELPFPQWEGKSILYLLPRDERWIIATWEIDWQTRKSILNNRQPEALVLQVHDLGPEDEPYDEPEVTSLYLDELSDNFFYDTDVRNHQFRAELGYLLDGEFHPIVRSNTISTAPSSPSDDDSVYFISLPRDVPFGVLADRLKAASVETADIALHLDALGMAELPPEGLSVAAKTEVGSMLKLLRSTLASNEAETSLIRPIAPKQR